MKLILGLGNPGAEYEKTRHNIGRRLMEFIAAQEKVKFASKKKMKASVASVSWEGSEIQLAYPLTYMNLSGEAVAAIVKYSNITAPQDLLVVVDDVALPFGKFRLRGEGSSGGHNGLLSIEEHLKSRAFFRLRIGIGSFKKEEPENSKGFDEPLRDYVLSAFSTEEEGKMNALLGRGMEACRAWAIEPLAKVMSRVNAMQL